MSESLKILMVAAECDPFAKTGGLGDVTGALPVFLKKLGHEVLVVMPLYASIDRERYGIHRVIGKMEVGKNGFPACSVSQTFLRQNVPVFFIDQEHYFGRQGIYHDENFNDYNDNPIRFACLSRTALQLCHELDFTPDIVHANDWHTAIIPAYLKGTLGYDERFKKTASVLTIHNLAYQGRYDRYFYYLTGLGQEDFTEEKFECYNAVNFLKGGIYYADAVNTVSQSYAAETLTPEGGFGLDRYLRKRGDDYSGILNGADYSVWDPSVDPLIPVKFSLDSPGGKTACKKILQQQMGLTNDRQVPVIGIVGRFVQQKGFYILAECIEDILNKLDVQFAILGTGDDYLENFFADLGRRYNGKVGLNIGFSNELAHLIEAGSDFFLMPSLYEPCGLNQIYSLRYGTLPIVRATGGLNDTVDNYDQETGEGTGFKFLEANGTAIFSEVSRALDTYKNRKDHMKRLIGKAMKQDFSWPKSAMEYVRLYRRALERKNSGPIPQ